MEDNNTNSIDLFALLAEIDNTPAAPAPVDHAARVTTTEEKGYTLGSYDRVSYFVVRVDGAQVFKTRFSREAYRARLTEIARLERLAA